MQNIDRSTSLFQLENFEDSDFLESFDLDDFEAETEADYSDYELQIQNLLALQPIFRLFIYMGNLEKETISNDELDAKIDWIYLSLIGLEYIAQVSLLQPGVSLEQFCSHLAKFAMRICPELDEQTAKTKANRVFDALINQKEKGRDFEFPYFSPSRKERVLFQFRIIEADKNHAIPYYRLTKTGTQIYLLMRMIKPEHFANAEEIIVQNLIEGRHYKEAILFAKRNQVRSNQYHREIMQEIFQAERNVHDFSYGAKLKSVLNDSTNHVNQEISRTQERVFSLENARRQSGVDHEAAQQIERLQKIFSELGNAHDRLYRQLLGTDTYYLHHIQPDKFKRRHMTLLPSLENKIFPLFSTQNLECLCPWTDDLLRPFLTRKRNLRIFDPKLAVMLIQANLEQECEACQEEVVAPKEKTESFYPDHFDNQTKEEGFFLLKSLLQEHKEIKTYTLMEKVQFHTENPKVLDFLAYLIYSRFMYGEMGEQNKVLIEKDGERFHYLHFRGDSLILKTIQSGEF